ncbi:hypothetical protein TSOC_006432 [Tetrabaena socialis]|uniref:phytol kinase n=1 Tax=Tetrabaena socialis TaxID=47790 RepID=A0A2J8A3P2_9CHLO|nr:hypothetical protein TSOC_006432 [Tetrabaena socialis]|eukprot:PNH07140.1 hypothetical protein TSOC_006432 [Tetrabaena socialis]
MSPTASRIKLHTAPSGGDALSAAAPPELAAALAGGLLPLWEQLLRRAGREPDCPDARLLTCMLEDRANHKGAWGLLAYCEPRQGAALVATLGKLLRTLAVPQLLSSVDAGDVGDGTPRAALAGALATCAATMLAGLLPGRLAGADGHDPGPMAAVAPQQQLARMLRSAVCEWLPPLARLVREGLPALKRAILGGGASQQSRLSIIACTNMVPCWLPVLARLSGAGLGQAAAAAEAADAAGASTAARTASHGAAGWQQLLLREVGAVAMLGALCRFHLWASAGTGTQLTQSECSDLVQGCCSVAAACPGELLRMLASELHASLPYGSLAAAASALARQAERWVTGGGENGGELARAVAALGLQEDSDVAALALASSSAEARALLRTCANPACDNMAGDSEAGLPLRACGRCGGAWYCRKECLAAHWRSGHRGACAGRGSVAAGVVGPAELAAASSAP